MMNSLKNYGFVNKALKRIGRSSENDKDKI